MAKPKKRDNLKRLLDAVRHTFWFTLALLLIAIIHTLENHWS